VASHELKTPLTSLKASLEILNNLIVEKPEGSPIDTFLRKATANAHKLNGLVNDLLNVNKIERGEFLPDKSNFYISQLITSYREINSSCNQNIIIHAQAEPMLFADKKQIEQVVLNLVNNAKKYAPDSGDIIVDIRQEDKNVKVTVTDKGPGIPGDEIPRLFKRYYRIDAVNKNISGMGLGLYIAAEIIGRHGGEIGVESVPGKGSSFWFSLPLDS